MAFIALIAFIAVPIIEIAVFIEVGGRIGMWSTVGIVILTAMLGTALLRQQGLSVLFRIQENLRANRMPVQELFDGVCLVLAGALLLTPGFVTDAVGFLLFVAPFRRWLAGVIAKRVIAGADVRYTSQTYTSSNGPEHPGRSDPFQSSGPVIDGEYDDITNGEEDGAVPPKRRIDGGRTNNTDDTSRD